MDDALTNEPPTVSRCPHCQRTERQVKAGTSNGVQRFKCRFCQRRYVSEPHRDYPDSLRQQARELHQEGRKIREIGRLLNVSPQTALNWLRRDTTNAPFPEPENTIEEAVESEKTVIEDIPSDKKRPTIKDVARAAGVSTSTISNFLNDKRRMGEETRQRIEAAIDALHFTPSALVRAIRHRRTRILGVLLWGIYELDTQVSESLTPPVLAGITSAADAAEYHILLYTGWPHRPLRPPGLEFLNGHIDGLLWVAPRLEEPMLERVAQAGLPVVAALTGQVPDGVGYVRTDNIAAMETSIGYLASQGHRSIAFSGPMHSSDFRERRQGYRDALTACNLKWDSALERTLPGEEFNIAAYEPILQDWLALPEPPTAIVMPNDGLADLMIRLIEQQGLRVPQDISVTGFDDIPSAAHLGGGLTTIRQPFREIGHTAVERLLALIEGASVKDCRISLPAPLIVRASTGPRTTRRSLPAR